MNASPNTNPMIPAPARTGAQPAWYLALAAMIGRGVVSFTEASLLEYIADRAVAAEGFWTPSLHFRTMGIVIRTGPDETAGLLSGLEKRGLLLSSKGAGPHSRRLSPSFSKWKELGGVQ